MHLARPHACMFCSESGEGSSNGRRVDGWVHGRVSFTFLPLDLGGDLGVFGGR